MAQCRLPHTYLQTARHGQERVLVGYTAETLEGKSEPFSG